MSAYLKSFPKEAKAWEVEGLKYLTKREAAIRTIQDLVSDGVSFPESATSDEIAEFLFDNGSAFSERVASLILWAASPDVVEPDHK